MQTPHGLRLKAVLDLANDEAALLDSPAVLPLHVLAALARQPEPAQALRDLGVRPHELRDRCMFVLGVNEGGRRHRDQTNGRATQVELSLLRGRTLPISDELAGVVADVEAAAEATNEAADWRHVLNRLSRILRAWGVSRAEVQTRLGLPPIHRPAPPRRTPPPTAHGPVLLFGGGSSGHEADDLHLALRAAGKDPRRFRVAGITAGASSSGATAAFIHRWRGLPGCESVWAGVSSAADAEDPSAAERIADADVIWFAGGDDVLLHDRVQGSLALQATTHAAASGALLVGWSAGTTCLGQGVVSDSRDGRDQFVPLLAWLPWVIQSHASGEAAERQLRSALRQRGGGTGLGVPHAGSVLVSADWTTAQVITAGWDASGYLLLEPDGERLPLPTVT